MTSITLPPAVPLDQKSEDAARDRLRQHFAPLYGNDLEDYVASVMATDHYCSRMIYFESVVGKDFLRKAPSAMVSGYAAGSEMIVARQYGMGKIVGVEIETIWQEVAQTRLDSLADMFPSLYKGDFLPYENEQFDVVFSGHVIEHTVNPQLYLDESLRVLKPGGYFSLEYPHRYHWQELHTKLLSFEWMPCLARNYILRLLYSNVSPLSPHVKHRYRAIVETHLQQISKGGVRKMLSRSTQAGRILNLVEPEPGVVRCVIQKDQG
jgi:ubiquinone/menaquinone biosynthesis C-methylase UbiE